MVVIDAVVVGADPFLVLDPEVLAPVPGVRFRGARRGVGGNPTVRPMRRSCAVLFVVTGTKTALRTVSSAPGPSRKGRPRAFVQQRRRFLSGCIHHLRVGAVR